MIRNWYIIDTLLIYKSKSGKVQKFAFK